MKYEAFLPDTRLRSIIKQYIIIYDTNILNKMLFLPNGGNFIIFNRGMTGHCEVLNKDRFEIPKGYSVSLKTNKSIKKCLQIVNSIVDDPCYLILVELQPIGFYKLFKKDASMLNESYMQIDSETIDKYFSNLYTHKNIQEEIAYLNQSLLKMSDSHNSSRECIEDVLDKIIDYHYEITIEELVKEFGCSRRTMERQFKKIIGFTPKKFIFLSKFYKTFIEYVQDGKKLKDIEYVYNDSAHLNKVFQNILGTNPSSMSEIVKNNVVDIYQLKISNNE